MTKSLFTALTLIALLVAACILLWVPEWMADQYRFAVPDDWVTFVSASRGTLATFLGAVAVAITIYFTYQNFKIAQDNVRLTEEKLVTDTFSKAVEQLGSADMSVRLGGIHSLARIAKSSQPDYFPTMQVLTGFVRNKYRSPAEEHVHRSSTRPGSSKCPVEVQAVVSIVGERYWPNPDGYWLDLSYIDVHDGWVPRADFRDVFFWEVRLTGWNFQGARLCGADFKRAVLDGCDFTDADLSGASFEDAAIHAPTGLTKAQLDSAANTTPGMYAAAGLAAQP